MLCLTTKVAEPGGDELGLAWCRAQQPVRKGPACSQRGPGIQAGDCLTNQGHISGGINVLKDSWASKVLYEEGYTPCRSQSALRFRLQGDNYVVQSSSTSEEDPSKALDGAR